MKKFFHRLIPALSLLCLPLFGGYYPGATRAALHLNETQLTAIRVEMAYQSGTATREYLITMITPGVAEGLEDMGPFADYRFFSMLTNFRHNSITSQAIVARTPEGQNFINTIGPGPTYAASYTYPGYGRFWFEVPKRKVHNFYGRQGPLTPWANTRYLTWVQRDMLVRATGSPYEWLRANPAGW